MKSRWSSGLWMSLLLLLLRGGPGGEGGSRGRWRSWRTTRRPRGASAPLSLPRLAVVSVLWAAPARVALHPAGAQHTLKVRRQKWDPGAQLRSDTEELSPAASVGVSRPSLGVCQGSCLTPGQDAGGESSASR